MKNYVFQQYVLEQVYVEQCCKVPFNLTFEEWQQIYINEGLLYTMPPVTKDHWIHPIDQTKPISVDNAVVSPKLFSPHVPTVMYQGNRPIRSQHRKRRGRITADIKPFPYDIKMN